MRLELKNIKKSFGEKEVLKDISFSVESGSAFGLLGRNGAGKTTSLRILMDVFPADSGCVLIDGAPADREKFKIGYLPEERGLYPKKKIIDQLVYFARLQGMGAKEAQRSCDNWLSKLGMSEYRNKRLDTLSKGNQQKIQLITALSHDPEIIILDEPFSGLDPVNAKLLKDVVKDEIKNGKIVIFSSHQMNYIEEFCDSIAILNGGRIVLNGTISDIKRAYPRDRLCVNSQKCAEIAEEYGEKCIKASGSEVMIKLSSPEEKPSVMRALSEKYDIDGVCVYEPSLNDIFVEYTKEGI